VGEAPSEMGEFGAAAKDWPKFKANLQTYMEQYTEVEPSWRYAEELFDAMKKEQNNEAAGTASPNTKSRKKASFDVSSYLDKFKLDVFKVHIDNEVTCSRTSILARPKVMGSKWNDVQAQGVDSPEELAAVQDLKWKKVVKAGYRKAIHDLRRALKLQDGQLASHDQAALRRFLWSDGIQEFLTEGRVKPEWLTSQQGKPWEDPLVELWLALMVKYQAAGVSASGEFFVRLKSLQADLDQGNKKYHELDAEFWAMMDPIAKAFTSVPEFAKHLRACFRHLVILDLASRAGPDNPEAECWAKARDVLIDSLKDVDVLKLEHTEEAVKIAEAQLKALPGLSVVADAAMTRSKGKKPSTRVAAASTPSAQVILECPRCGKAHALHECWENAADMLEKKQEYLARLKSDHKDGKDSKEGAPASTKGVKFSRQEKKQAKLLKYAMALRAYDHTDESGDSSGPLSEDGF